MDDIKFSIVMPVFNNEKTVEQTITSILQQSYKNFELIVIDGGSTDNTVKIIEKYIDLISYFVSEKDNGIYNAMNKGFKVATGDYFAVIGSDDYYFNDSILDSIVTKIEKTAYKDFYFGNAVKLKLDGNQKIIKGNLEKVRYKNTIPHPTLFIKNELFRKLGGFNEKYNISSDYDLILQLVNRKCTHAYINEELVCIRQGGVSFSSFKGSIEGLRIKFQRNNLFIFSINLLYFFESITYKFISKLFKQRVRT